MPRIPERPAPAPMSLAPLATQPYALDLSAEAPDNPDSPRPKLKMVPKISLSRYSMSTTDVHRALFPAEKPKRGSRY